MLIHTGIAESRFSGDIFLYVAAYTLYRMFAKHSLHLFACIVADIHLMQILVSKYFVKNKLNALKTFIDKIVYSN